MALAIGGNRWDCDYPGCTEYVVGLGGAIGLRAIGWYFKPAGTRQGGHPLEPSIACPRHRFDAERHGPNLRHPKETLCGICPGQRDADRFQALIAIADNGMELLETILRSRQRHLQDEHKPAPKEVFSKAGK